MTQLRDRIALLESSLQNLQEIDLTPQTSSTNIPARHSLDHRFDKTPTQVDPTPLPNPAQEEPIPFNATESKPQFYDSIAATFGLGIRDQDEFVEYNVHDASLTNMRVCPVDLTHPGNYYYVEHRSFLPNVPGVILRQGSGKKGKVLGVSHLPFVGRNTFGLGDLENNPAGMVWETMANTGFWTHMKYAFEYEVPGGQRRRFCWIRTRNNFLWDDQGDLVLVEEGREDLVLVEYLGQGPWKWAKRGRLRIRSMEAFGPGWEIILLLTWGSVVE
ncbi:hypothetical protein LSUE1_G008608 [Lachnellula suecica]|uniref:Uncharacterized protein n=1 Tax=Lachnellula suecica TaxID=602035 RepID=A0A8T9BVY5_9HELO|nr:hypothetical protein LSUE1_G008608 [Lachnellula suecica]